jgi:hypothetical protein
MDEATKFLVLAIEGYKLEKNMHGKDVVALFDKHGVIDYILEFHNVLHTQGIKALVCDIDDFIAHHPLDYTEWQRDLWKGKTIEEIHQEATDFYNKKHENSP